MHAWTENVDFSHIYKTSQKWLTVAIFQNGKTAVWHYGLKLQQYLTGDMVWFGMGEGRWLVSSYEYISIIYYNGLSWTIIEGGHDWMLQKIKKNLTETVSILTLKTAYFHTFNVLLPFSTKQAKNGLQLQSGWHGLSWNIIDCHGLSENGFYMWITDWQTDIATGCPKKKCFFYPVLSFWLWERCL